MKRPATILWGLVVIPLTVLGSLYAARSGSHPFLLLPDRIVDIRFVVDNPKFLVKNSLELAVRENNLRRRLVDIKSDDGYSGTGLAQVPVPDGPINVVVCGFVQCGDGGDTEMFCGESRIPSYIEVDKVHEVHFSTDWACQNSPSSSPLARSR